MKLYRDLATGEAIVYILINFLSSPTLMIIFVLRYELIINTKTAPDDKLCLIDSRGDVLTFALVFEIPQPRRSRKNAWRRKVGSGKSGL